MGGVIAFILVNGWAGSEHGQAAADSSVPRKPKLNALVAAVVAKAPSQLHPKRKSATFPDDGQPPPRGGCPLEGAIAARLASQGDRPELPHALSMTPVNPA
jgi:hypothetical protein